MNREHLLAVFSAGFQKFMERKCVTVRHMAKQLGCTEQNVYNMNNGKNLPSFEILVHLVSEGMRLDEIFGEIWARKLMDGYTEHKAKSSPMETAHQAKALLTMLLEQVEKVEGQVAAPDRSKPHGT